VVLTFAVAPDVERALREGRPVVALETTLVTHGLPAAEGLAVAHALEDDVRAAGAQPATIGVLDGALRVGLSRAELERLARAPGVQKANLGNLAALITGGGPASTTVSASVFAAHKAGIGVLATGGIGGVHRDFAETGDVSSDLAALARYPVAVVCAGAKAILDLPRTVEALETLGVPVYGFRTASFPAFYRRDSGLPIDRAFEDVRALAEAVAAHRALGLGTGVVIGNPVPAAQEMPAVVYETTLARALDEARAGSVRGRDVTPFLLQKLEALTQGRSVFSNVALLRHNARLAGELAVALRSTP
jgi:pseudouridine-5'-phosphate glycosidase